MTARGGQPEAFHQRPRRPCNRHGGSAEHCVNERGQTAFSTGVDFRAGPVLGMSCTTTGRSVDNAASPTFPPVLRKGPTDPATGGRPRRRSRRPADGPAHPRRHASAHPPPAPGDGRLADRRRSRRASSLLGSYPLPAGHQSPPVARPGCRVAAAVAAPPGSPRPPPAASRRPHRRGCRRPRQPPRAARLSAATGCSTTLAASMVASAVGSGMGEHPPVRRAST